jgi:hypothetical protein
MPDGALHLPDAYRVPDRGSAAGSLQTSYVRADAGALPSRGMRGGTVVPSATEDGISLGWDPQHPPHNRVLVMDDANGAVELDLDRLDPRKSALALQAAGQLVGPVTDVASRRERGLAAVHIAARNGAGTPVTDLRSAMRRAGSAPGVTEPAPPPAAEPVYAHKAAWAEPAAEPPAPVVAPAPAPVGGGRFNRASLLRVVREAEPDPMPAPQEEPRMTPADPYAREPLYQPPPPPPAPPEPSIEAWFETDAGEMTAYYHDAVRKDATLVLVYDNRYRGPRFFPRATDEPFVVVLGGGPLGLMVESPGITFDHDGKTFCVPLVVARLVCGAESAIMKYAA